jgi:DMSO/TMAO reductase YedYZ molybdopterin-dependent catalytic subunit
MFDKSKSDAIISPDTKREERIPPGQHEVTSFPVLHYGPVPEIPPETWTFRIFGLVDKERTLSQADFAALPRIRVFSDIHCVTTWSRLNNLWEGVSTSEIKNLVSIKAEAKYVLVHAAYGFTTNLSLDDFFQPDVLFATDFNEHPLTKEHGGPVRLVVPRLYFWKSAKWVTGVEFIAEDEPGFWEQNGYHMHGDPWTEERYG